MFNKNSFSAPKRPKKPKAEKVKAEKSPKTSTPKAGFSFGGSSKGFSGKAPKTTKSNFGGAINLTEQQKKIVIISAIAVVVVIVAVVVGVVIANIGNSFGSGNSGAGGSQGAGEITNFYISSEPTKTVYKVGDNPNYSGLSVHLREDGVGSRDVYYDDEPESFTITGFDSSAPAESQTITVEYMGQTDTFTVNINAPVDTPKIESIYLDPAPNNTFVAGDFPDFGCDYVVVYDDGTEVRDSLTLADISGWQAIANTPGEHTLTVKYYDEYGGYITTTFTVTITAE